MLYNMTQDYWIALTNGLIVHFYHMPFLTFWIVAKDNVTSNKTYSRKLQDGKSGRRCGFRAFPAIPRTIAGEEDENDIFTRFFPRLYNLITTLTGGGGNRVGPPKRQKDSGNAGKVREGECGAANQSTDVAGRCDSAKRSRP